MAWPFSKRYEEVKLPALELPPMTDEWNQGGIDAETRRRLLAGINTKEEWDELYASVGDIEKFLKGG
jgi:hypothetical protein